MLTYIGILIVFSIVGIFVPTLVIREIIVPAILDKIHGVKPKKPLGSAKSLFEKKKKKPILKILGNKMMNIFTNLIMIGMCALCIFSFIMVVPYWVDIVNVVTGNRGTTTGVLKDIYVEKEHESGKLSWGWNRVEIDNTWYNIGAFRVPAGNTKVTVKYLPLTKIITSLEVAH